MNKEEKKIGCFGEFPKSLPSKNNPIAKMIKKAMEEENSKLNEVSDRRGQGGWELFVRCGCGGQHGLFLNYSPDKDSFLWVGLGDGFETWSQMTRLWPRIKAAFDILFKRTKCVWNNDVTLPGIDAGKLMKFFEQVYLHDKLVKRFIKEER